MTWGSVNSHSTISTYSNIITQYQTHQLQPSQHVLSSSSAFCARGGVLFVSRRHVKNQCDMARSVVYSRTNTFIPISLPDVEFTGSSHSLFFHLPTHLASGVLSLGSRHVEIGLVRCDSVITTTLHPLLTLSPPSGCFLI